MAEAMAQAARSANHMEIMQNLLQEILHIQLDNTNLDKGIQRIQEIVMESSKVVENSTSPSEMIIDAKIFHTGTTVVNATVASLNTNLTSFSESQYVNGVLSYLENSDQVVLVGKEWECLAPITYHMFKKSASLAFMLGSVSLEPPQGRERTRIERQRKSPATQKTCLTTVKVTEKPAEEGSDIYDHILKWLVRHYKKNDRKPISYFNFIINPYDYWKTIENIFHFAFLVRDGSVKMSLVDELPYVEPTIRKPEDKLEKPTTNYQFCLSLSMSEWRKCVQRFGIAKPSIPVLITQN